MRDELFEYKRQFHRLAIETDYVREKLTKHLIGKDGFGERLEELLRVWTQTMHESFEYFKTMYGWVDEILSRSD